MGFFFQAWKEYVMDREGGEGSPGAIATLHCSSASPLQVSTVSYRKILWLYWRSRE